jgi:uncharacterized Ntn-hydrolase superfamily protein
MRLVTRALGRTIAGAALLCLAAAPAVPQNPSRRPVATYSIVARDSATGEIGVAVQSHWFSVGSAVPWAEAGVGAVATQSFTDPSYGALGLELIRAGKTAPEALRGLIAADPDSAVRQVAMIDARGRVAAFTGKRAIVAAGHRVGNGYSVQANLMDKPSVWPAMARAFEQAKGDLAERMLQALEAAEGEGGDIRGRQSAAILVVAGAATGPPWADRVVDLRVEDHPAPLVELRRLVTLSRLYRRMNEGDDWTTKGDMAKAVTAYNEATGLLPDSATNGEAVFWTGISLASARRDRDAIPYLARAYAVHPAWADLVPRLPGAGLLPKDSALVDRLVTGMRSARPPRRGS